MSAKKSALSSDELKQLVAERWEDIARIKQRELLLTGMAIDKMKPPAPPPPIHYEPRREYEGDMPLAERVHLARAVSSLLAKGSYPDGTYDDEDAMYTASEFLACVMEELDNYMGDHGKKLPPWEPGRKMIQGREGDRAPTDGDA